MKEQEEDHAEKHYQSSQIPSWNQTKAPIAKSRRQERACTHKHTQINFL